jgi:pimeloyl-ACP methyl ester carboxylesterase
VNGLCTSRGVGQYVASETHDLVWARQAKQGLRLVVTCQGSHSLADSVLTADSWQRTQVLCDAGFVVICGDLSQTASQGTFGNDTAQTRVGQLRTFATGTGVPVPTSGKMHLIGGSGGCTAAINYARANPQNVASMYLIAPLADVENFYSNWTDATITQAEVNKAYNNGVDDGGTAYTAAMPAHNPSRAGNQAALSGVPMRLAYSTNDPYIPVSTVTNYQSLITAAGGSCSIVSQGAVGHSGTGVDPADVVRFFQTNA